MYDNLMSLLRQTESTNATLIHVGDIISKGPHSGSMAVLKYMTQRNITGVRGNHDQQVIEWRGWIDWVSGLPGGKKWLNNLEKDWERYVESTLGSRLHELAENPDPKPFLATLSQYHTHARIPHGWILFSTHYRIARAMSDEEYKYLLSLPLALHIPSAHTFVVHAGILPHDPTLKWWDTRQPLAKVPRTGNRNTMRKRQELAVLEQVPQNRDPWVLLNMRSIKGSKVTKYVSVHIHYILPLNKPDRLNSGEPWSKIWTRDSSHCVGFPNGTIATGTESNHNLSGVMAREKQKHTLPCNPATVLYGHAAARGLAVRRWTIGLDAGCVYGRRMAALVLQGQGGIDGQQVEVDGEWEDRDLDESDDDEDDEGEDDEDVINAEKKEGIITRTVRFGDKGWGKIVSVKC